MNRLVTPLGRVSAFRRVFMGIGIAGFGHGVRMFEVIVLVPWFLQAWGTDGYGRWIALTAVVSYLSLMDLGGQTYVSNLLAMNWAGGEKVAFRRTLSEGVSLFLVIGIGATGVLLLVLLALLEFPLPILGRSLYRWEAWVLGLIGANFLLVSIPGGLYASSYRATGLFARGALIGNLLRGLGIGVSIGLLWGSARPEIYASGMLGMGVVSIIVIVRDTRRVIPGCVDLCISLAEARKGLGLLKGAIRFWLISVAHAAKQQGVILVLAASASPVIVATYVTHRTVSNVAGFVGPLVQGPLLPEMSFLWAQKRFIELSRITFITIRSILVSTVVIALLLWLTAPSIFPLWTGQRIQMEPILLGLLLGQGVLVAAWTPSCWGLMATNHHGPLALFSLANAALTIGAAAWLARSYGAVGAALGSLVGDLVFGFVVFPVLASSFLAVSSTRVYAEMAVGTVAGLPIVGLAILTNGLGSNFWSVGTYLLGLIVLSYPLSCLLFGRSNTQGAIQMVRTVFGLQGTKQARGEIS